MNVMKRGLVVCLGDQWGGRVEALAHGNEKTF